MASFGKAVGCLGGGGLLVEVGHGEQTLSFHSPAPLSVSTLFPDCRCTVMSLLLLSVTHVPLKHKLKQTLLCTDCFLPLQWEKSPAQGSHTFWDLTCFYIFFSSTVQRDTLGSGWEMYSEFDPTGLSTVFWNFPVEWLGLLYLSNLVEGIEQDKVEQSLCQCLEKFLEVDSQPCSLTNVWSIDTIFVTHSQCSYSAFLM